MIRSGGFKPGNRLPAISAIARQFRVGAPTVREALAKLEITGIVDVRHGSGVYVGTASDALLIANPGYAERPARKLLVELIDARIPIERRTAALAADHATPAHIAEMRRLLRKAEDGLDDAELMAAIDLSFHRQIALASGNSVMHQLIDALLRIFPEEQRAFDGNRMRARDEHAEHVMIFEAIRDRDAALAVQRMQGHLEIVREVMRSSEASPTSD
jgi:GntR family transcriptional regulator, transcriptional repressor for pyruvate dehydrogenase complex